MCNMCFLPSTGISARIFAKWLELPTLNEINDLIETGFVQTTKRCTISLHPMIQEITLSETKPSVSSCHTLLDSLQHMSNRTLTLYITNHLVDKFNPSIFPPCKFSKNDKNTLHCCKVLMIINYSSI